jgi:hypothetical protein
MPYAEKPYRDPIQGIRAKYINIIIIKYVVVFHILLYTIIQIRVR